MLFWTLENARPKWDFHSRHNRNVESSSLNWSTLEKSQELLCCGLLYCSYIQSQGTLFSEGHEHYMACSKTAFALLLTGYTSTSETADWLYRLFSRVKIKCIHFYKWALWIKILVLCVIKRGTVICKGYNGIQGVQLYTECTVVYRVYNVIQRSTIIYTWGTMVCGVYNRKGAWKKALSDFWSIAILSFQIALYLLEKIRENLTLQKDSLRTLFHTHLQFMMCV